MSNVLRRDPDPPCSYGDDDRVAPGWRHAAPGAHGLVVWECLAPAPGGAKPPELARREARPACEGAREMGRIGVPEVQRDLDDLAGRILEHPLREVEPSPCDDTPVRHALVGQATLERPGAQPHHLRDGMHVRVAVAEQPGDDLVHDAAEPGCPAPSL